MTISIIKKLEASPNPTQLPRRIHFKGVLKTDFEVADGNEEITLVYSLDAGATGIRFQGSKEGEEVTSFRRTMSVPPVAGGAPYEHRAKMAGKLAKPGDSFEMVGVSQTITDADGVKRTRKTIVQVDKPS